MRRERLTAISLAYVITIASIAGVLLALGPGVAAANHGGTPYAVGQDGQCVTELHPLGDGSQSGPSYYDYHDYASFGTTDIQRTYLSQLYLYRSANGTNLVFLHDELGDGTGGGAVTFDFTGLPASGEWTVEDDDYLGQDDRPQDFDRDKVDWMYGYNKTDGGMYLGLGGDDWTEITIDPAFAEESWAWQEREPRWNEEDGYPEMGKQGPREWVVRNADGTTTQLNMTQRLSLRKGGCTAVSPTAALSGPDTASADTTVTLEASSPDSPTTPIEYRWDFQNDGTIDANTTSTTVERNYSSSGQVTAAVTVVDRFGATETATKTITIEGNAPPTAVASVPASATVGETVTVDASGSSDDEGIASYEWDLGDGTTATGATATHAYSAVGSYTVTLTVTDGEGANDTVAETIEVTEAEPSNRAPTVDLTAEPQSVSAGGDVTLAANASDPDDDQLSYEWSQVAGNESLALPAGENGTVTPSEPGTYEVRVTVEDEAGASDSATATFEAVESNAAPAPAFDWVPANPETGQSVTFDASNSSDADGSIASFEWDLDDDGSYEAAGPSVEHAFATPGGHDVSLRVTDDGGATATTTQTVDVVDGASDTNQPPTAALAANETQVAPGDSVALDATGSSDPEGDELRYDWRVVSAPSGADVSPPTGPSGDVSLQEPGEYTFEVNVSDGNRSDVATATVEVAEAAEPDDAPTAAFDWSPTDPEPGEAVSLDASSSTDADGSIASYEWDVGADGRYEKTGIDATVAFDAAGSHDVRLRVTDDEGATDTVVRTVDVAEPNPKENEPPEAALVASDTKIRMTRSVTLDASGSSDPDGSDDALAYEWTVTSAPEGATLPALDAAPTNEISFDETGTYEVQVTVEDAEGGTDSATETIEVFAKPFVHVDDISIEDRAVEVEEKAEFDVLVHNAGWAAGEMNLKLTVDGEVVENRTVEVGPREEETYTLVHCFERSGNYTVSIHGESVEPIDVEVTAPDHRLEELSVGDDGAGLDAGSSGSVTAEVNLVVEGKAVTEDGLTAALENLSTAEFDATVGTEDATVTNISAGDPKRNGSTWTVPLELVVDAPSNDAGAHDLTVALDLPNACWPVADVDCAGGHSLALTGEDVVVYEAAGSSGGGSVGGPSYSYGGSASSSNAGSSGGSSSDAEDGDGGTTPTTDDAPDEETESQPSTSTSTSEASSPGSATTEERTTREATPGSTETAAPGQPGFGVALAVLAVLGAALLARRRT